MNEIKKALLMACSKLVNDRVIHVEKSLKEIQDEAGSEAKSSMGDKYETGTAMIHLENEKLATQLTEALKVKRVLDLIDISKSYQKVQLGSLVVTPEVNYFIAVSVGLLKVDDISYFAISPVSPVGQQLMGKKIGQHFVFNGKSVLIENII